MRADQVIGIDAHQSPSLTGKTSRWLLDVVVAVPIGSGDRDGWTMTALHQTLEQTDEDPGDAQASLAHLLARLDLAGAAGVITVRRDVAAPVAGADVIADARQLRFRFPVAR